MARTSSRNGGNPAAAATLALALAVALGACGQRSVWTKEGLTADELRRDQKACNEEADSYGFLNLSGSTPGTSTGSTTAARQQGDIFRGCMNGRGYTQAPFDPNAPPPPAQ